MEAGGVKERQRKVKKYRQLLRGDVRVLKVHEEALEGKRR